MKTNMSYIDKREQRTFSITNSELKLVLYDNHDILMVIRTRCSFFFFLLTHIGVVYERENSGCDSTNKPLPI